ncbi:hypothetical protein [Paraburkholderia acidiphila]|uniref:Uncharacterized protein n=1 Tax=Paraburkholderia acidiphila TaxID=2571747 RepID=A0A7Z2JCJ0_9BURK|nr:hypothetical protein [Paraburkholderia acidiphila]QGZ59676.1 hypothetical protein FAZ97_32395 [Paraburkholderia acidiphila]
MQIGAATQFANSSANTNTLRAGAASDQAEQDGAQSSDGSTNAVSSPTQDDAVQISPQGYAAASTDEIADGDDAASNASDTTDTSDTSDTSDTTDASDTSDTTDASDTSDAADAGSTPANAQPMKSLVYGALGLERPDVPADPNHTYTLGRWIAAGITLGGIISLFI